MIEAHADWESGNTPVTLGQAPWLPLAFTQAVHYVRQMTNREHAAKNERRKHEQKKTRHG